MTEFASSCRPVCNRLYCLYEGVTFVVPTEESAPPLSSRPAQRDLRHSCSRTPATDDTWKRISPFQPEVSPLRSEWRHKISHPRAHQWAPASDNRTSPRSDHHRPHCKDIAALAPRLYRGARLRYSEGGPVAPRPSAPRPTASPPTKLSEDVPVAPTPPLAGGRQGTRAVLPLESCSR